MRQGILVISHLNALGYKITNSKLQIKYAIITTGACHGKLKPGCVGRGKGRVSTERFHCESSQVNFSNLSL